MEPQLLIASLYEHVPARTTGQHDFLPARTEGAKFDTIGVIIALLSMIGIMVAVAMMSGGGSAPLPRPNNPHLMSNR